MSELAEKIRNKLTVDESIIIEHVLDRLSKLIGITKTGKVIFKISREALTTKNQIALYAIGKYMAKQAGYIESDQISIEELTRELGISPKIASTRAGELRREESSSVSREECIRINPILIESIISEIEGHSSR